MAKTSKSERRLLLLRFTIFYIWLVTLLLTLVVFLSKMVAAKMHFADISPSLRSILALVLPQLGVMLAFFFGVDRNEQARIISVDPHVAHLAMTLSAIYHFVFVSLLVLAIIFEGMGTDVAQSTAAFVEVMAYLSLIGVTPVTFMFARSHNQGKPKRTNALKSVG